MTSCSEEAILQLMHLPRVGPRTLDKVLTAVEDGAALEAVLRGPVSGLERLGIKGVDADTLAQARARAESSREALEEHAIRLLVKGQRGYPASLFGDDQAPPVLFARGLQAILDRKGVAFCGSRHASPQGLNITAQCAELLAREGLNIVSGYADGVDLTAHAAALSAGGVTTFVMAEGILRFKPKPEVAEMLQDDNHLIVSQFPPRLPWSVGNAMQRNATVLGLAAAVLVIESGKDGGTFAAAELAQSQGRPLFVVEYPDPPPSAQGNRHFLIRGAIPLRVKPDGTPQVADLLRVLEQGETPTLPAASEVRQRDLFE